MSLRLVAIRATEPGVCVVEFDRGGGEPLICTFRVEEHHGMAMAVTDPGEDPFADFDGTADEQRQIVGAIIDVSQLSARKGSS